ncbi:MAG: PQQ-binding-like beta-propeller repeat protein [Haloferacaceae archaeon]
MSPVDPPVTTSETPSRSSRRAFIASAATVTATALAGCSALTDDDRARVHDGDWHSFGNGPTNANHVAGGLPEPDGHESLTAADWPYTPPVVHDGVAYVAAERRVVAVDPADGERWSRRLDAEVSGAPALDPDRGRIYVPTRSGGNGPESNEPESTPASVTVISLAGGDVLDAHRVGKEQPYGVSVVDGDVYARCASACVRLAPDGTERWRRPLEPLVYDEYNLGDSTATQIAPAVTDDGVYVPDRDALVKLDRGTGEERWRVDVDTPYAAPTAVDGGVVQTGWQGTVAVDDSGEVRWRRNLHSRAAAAASDGDVYVVAGDLHELAADSGETNWRAHLPSEGTAAPVVADDAVLAVAGDVRAFDRNASGVPTAERKRWQTSAVHATAYASPVIAAGHVFVASPDSLLALQPKGSE